MDLYKGTRFLTFEGSADGLHVQNFRMPVLGYDPGLKPPADFKVFHLLPHRVRQRRSAIPSRIQ
jgi:hypothetical protein